MYDSPRPLQGNGCLVVALSLPRPGSLECPRPAVSAPYSRLTVALMTDGGGCQCVCVWREIHNGSGPPSQPMTAAGPPPARAVRASQSRPRFQGAFLVSGGLGPCVRRGEPSCSDLPSPPPSPGQAADSFLLLPDFRSYFLCTKILSCCVRSWPLSPWPEDLGTHNV